MTPSVCTHKIKFERNQNHLLMEKYTEYQHQVLVIAWARSNEDQYPALKLLNASMAGVRLPIGLAMKCKKSGMVKGFPDLFLPYPSGPYSGFFCELKKKGGSLKKEQKVWLENLSRCGFYTCKAVGHEEAIEQLEAYVRVAKPIELL